VLLLVLPLFGVPRMIFPYKIFLMLLLQPSSKSMSFVMGSKTPVPGTVLGIGNSNCKNGVLNGGYIPCRPLDHDRPVERFDSGPVILPLRRTPATLRASPEKFREIFGRYFPTNRMQEKGVTSLDFTRPYCTRFPQDVGPEEFRRHFSISD